MTRYISYSLITNEANEDIRHHVQVVRFEEAFLPREHPGGCTVRVAEVLAERDELDASLWHLRHLISGDTAHDVKKEHDFGWGKF